MRTHRTPRFRLAGWIAVGAMLALAVFGPAGVEAAGGYTPGGNGHPTNGPYSDLKGGSGTFTFEQNGQLFCTANDTATSFSFKLDYSNASLPAGASIVVYLSPNQGAINANAGGDDASYIAAVESNYGVITFASGLSGSGTLDVQVNVTTAFQATGGGILGVVATESDGTSVTTSKTNSLNCTEANPTPTPSTATPTPSVATPTPSVATPTPSVATPTPSVATPTPSVATPTPSVATPTPSTATPTPSVASPTPTGSVEASTSTAPSTSPTGSVEATSSAAPSTSPTGGVEGVTGTPRTTLPPTDTLGGAGSTPTSGGWRLLLIGLAGLLASILVLVPSPKRIRR